MAVFLGGLMINLFEEEENRELRKFYPGMDVTDKYILFVYPTHVATQVESVICGSVAFAYKTAQSGMQEMTYGLSYPRRSQNAAIIGMAREKETCKLGIPLIFDSFEEMQNLKHVEVHWLLKHSEEMEGYICRQDVEFAIPDSEDKKRFGIKISTNAFEEEHDFIEKYKARIENKKEVEREVLEGDADKIQVVFALDQFAPDCTIKGYRLKRVAKADSYAIDIR